MGCPVIPAASINPTSDAVFSRGTPLLYYVLAEAQRAHSTLGCVGAGIITQVFLRVLWGHRQLNSAQQVPAESVADPDRSPQAAVLVRRPADRHEARAEGFIAQPRR
jgi:hypothetical protein